MSRSETTLYLSRAVWHDEHGVGYFSFEEADAANTVRILEATFADKTLRGCIERMEELGVSWRGAPIYRGERIWTMLVGHHGAQGYSHDEAPVREQLRAEAELRAAA